MKDTHLTLRLPADLARALTRLARGRDVPKSEVVREAVGRHRAPPPASDPIPTVTGREAASRWRRFPHLSPEEAAALAADIAAGRRAMPSSGLTWCEPAP